MTKLTEREINNAFGNAHESLGEGELKEFTWYAFFMYHGRVLDLDLNEATSKVLRSSFEEFKIKIIAQTTQITNDVSQITKALDILEKGLFGEDEKEIGEMPWNTYDYNLKLHSYDDQPARNDNGMLRWYSHGILHRENGPAVLFPDGTTQSYIDGIYLPDTQEGEMKIDFSVLINSLHLEPIQEWHGMPFPPPTLEEDPLEEDPLEDDPIEDDLPPQPPL